MKWIYVKINEIENPVTCDMLSPSRRTRIERIKNADAKKASLAGEYVARQLAENVTVCSRSSGQPYLENDRRHISIAHSGEYAVCAISESPVGIDIEKIREVSNRLIDRVCTEREKQYVGDSTERFFEIWTAKEAYFKKIGTGITDFKSVETLDLVKEYHRLGDYIVCIIKK